MVFFQRRDGGNYRNPLGKRVREKYVDLEALVSTTGKAPFTRSPGSYVVLKARRERLESS